MTTDPDTLINNLIALEGGYVNNANDKGGETNFGITIAQARAYGYNGPMRSLPIDIARNIYASLYWGSPHFNAVYAIMPRLGAALLNSGANMGPNTVSKYLQRSLNVLNRGATDFPDIAVDGNFGLLSQQALKQFAAKRGPDAETVLLRMLEALIAVHYIQIAEANPSQETFEYGWIFNRVGDA